MTYLLKLEDEKLDLTVDAEETEVALDTEEAWENVLEALVVLVAEAVLAVESPLISSGAKGVLRGSGFFGLCERNESSM